METVKRKVEDTRMPDSEREVRFREIYASTYTDVLRFAQRRVHPSHAEDVASDAFLVAWRRFDDAPRDEGNVRAWLFGIARNCILNSLRGQGRRYALDVRLAETGSDFTHGLDDDLILRRMDLASAWQKLSGGYQETLSLTVFEELTSQQAARLLGISPVSYRLRLMRARRALRRLLDHELSAGSSKEGR